jgi:hypothetical protein
MEQKTNKREKWAYYLISAVRYDGTGERIERVLVHEYWLHVIVGGAAWPRRNIRMALERASEVCTIRKASDGSWLRGEDVHLVEVDGATYLRTDDEPVARDDLGDLRTF